MSFKVDVTVDGVPQPGDTSGVLAVLLLRPSNHTTRYSLTLTPNGTQPATERQAPSAQPNTSAGDNSMPMATSKDDSKANDTGNMTVRAGILMKRAAAEPHSPPLAKRPRAPREHMVVTPPRAVPDQHFLDAGQWSPGLSYHDPTEEVAALGRTPDSTSLSQTAPKTVVSSPGSSPTPPSPEGPEPPSSLFSEANGRWVPSQLSPYAARPALSSPARTKSSQARLIDSSQTEPESPTQVEPTVSSSQTQPESPTQKDLIPPASQPGSAIVSRSAPSFPTGPKTPQAPIIDSSQTEPESPTQAEPPNDSSQTEPESPRAELQSTTNNHNMEASPGNNPRPEETQVVPDSEGEEELHIPSSPVGPGHRSRYNDDTALHRAVRHGMQTWSPTQVENFYDLL